MVVMVNDYDIVIGYVSLYDGVVRVGSIDDYWLGVIGIKYVCGIFFVFVKCVSMVK